LPPFDTGEYVGRKSFWEIFHNFFSRTRFMNTALIGESILPFPQNIVKKKEMAVIEPLFY
jgi:hypothetical protein